MRALTRAMEVEMWFSSQPDFLLGGSSYGKDMTDFSDLGYSLLPVANQYLKFKSTYLLRYLELEGFLRDLGVSAMVLFLVNFFFDIFYSWAVKSWPEIISCWIEWRKHSGIRPLEPGVGCSCPNREIGEFNRGQTRCGRSRMWALSARIRNRFLTHWA